MIDIIYVSIQKDIKYAYVERQGLPSDKVNKSFNESKFGNV